MQLDIFYHSNYNQLVEELFEAYFACRKNKRNTVNALRFERELEVNVFRLADEIFLAKYTTRRSIAFIVTKPVTREIFAADFRDRVVHHWLIQKLNPLFESYFLPDSYACRENKGTHYGIGRIRSHILACSENYKMNCYVLKLDIQGFFMRINRGLLFNKLSAFIQEHYNGHDRELVLSLSKQILFCNPVASCLIRGNLQQWEGLPNNKSLFHSPPNCGLPIGNLTSQVFANFYLHVLDTYITRDLGISYYGRYVDDFILVDRDKEKLKAAIPRIRNFLYSELELTLHPKKIYLQHAERGLKFLGAVIKKNRTFIANRTKGNFYAAIKRQNEIIKSASLSPEILLFFQSTVNSYLGCLRHFNSFKQRRKIIDQLSPQWFDFVTVDNDLRRIALKRPIGKVRIFRSLNRKL